MIVRKNNRMIVKQFSIYQYIVYPVLVMVMSAYSLIVHLFKRLRNLLGKVCLCIVALATALMYYWITVNSQAITIYHTATIMFTLTHSYRRSIIFNKHISCIIWLTSCSYCCCYLKLKISKKRSEYLFKCYTT